MPRGYTPVYLSETDRMRGTSIAVSTGLGRALAAIVEPVKFARWAPIYGWPSVSDELQNIHTPVSTGLRGLGRLGAADDESMGTDEEMSQPVEADRDPSFWSFLSKGIETVPSALVKGVTAYKSYETQGGGTAGASAAVLSIFGTQAQANAQAAARQQAAVKAAQTSATPWYKSPGVLLGVGTVGVLTLALIMKK